jgi:hypothetical protein
MVRVEGGGGIGGRGYSRERINDCIEGMSVVVVEVMMVAAKMVKAVWMNFWCARQDFGDERNVSGMKPGECKYSLSRRPRRGVRQDRQGG